MIALPAEPLRRAFRHPEPAARTVSPAANALRLRAQLVCAPSPRELAHQPRPNPEIRSYPAGFRISRLGTFPTAGAGCPVAAAADVDE
ncbi:hypothetical protein [Kitasatospora viridis]|uniref:Uncharacterized protein n=1 Tax=Kitasatospora viridis TaxID=281105 RepID=A0A561UHB2_9ACTN|nr:hypothetical protein [Kitasatospora viridis]TWF98756.1 hypothetical protein FHX73_112578 [Kitasatospora viridis]